MFLTKLIYRQKSNIFNDFQIGSFREQPISQSQKLMYEKDEEYFCGYLLHVYAVLMPPYHLWPSTNGVVVLELKAET